MHGINHTETEMLQLIVLGIKHKKARAIVADEGSAPFCQPIH